MSSLFAEIFCAPVFCSSGTQVCFTFTAGCSTLPGKPVYTYSFPPVVPRQTFRRAGTSLPVDTLLSSCTNNHA